MNTYVTKKKLPKLTFLQKMKMALEIAQGMNWLHKQNPPLLHLDLKPANLLLMEGWTVKIADFGMSRLQPKKDQEVLNVGGTPLYMPPEVFQAKPQMTDKCDVYAYGIILWEMVTEQYPYDKKYKSIILLQNAVRDEKERPVLTDKIPKSLGDLMKKCWDHDATKRPTFSQILDKRGNENDVFSTSVSEAVAGSGSKDLNGKISQMWGKFTRGRDGQVSSVSWDAFSKEFSQLMRTKADHQNMIALKALLNVDDNSDQVTWTNFHHFVETFGPFEPSGGVKTSTLDEISKLVQEKWFWGDLSGEEAANVLQSCKPGSFLIRFSANVVGVFTLSYRHAKDNKVIHKRFDKSSIKWQLLAEEIKKEKRALKLSRPPPDRPPKFAVLFQKHADHAGGYTVKYDIGPSGNIRIETPFNANALIK